MEDLSKVGTDWSSEELDAIVADYFAMLAAQQAGETFVKAHRARALDEQIGRGHKSIEFKHMNISAVLAELGLPNIRGYRPMSNYQRAIFPAVERYLDDHPDAWDIGDAVVAHPLERSWEPEAAPNGAKKVFQQPFPGMAEQPSTSPVLIFEDAPSPAASRKPRPEGLERLIRKFDPAARDHRNRLLGQAGEERVFLHEKARLKAAGYSNLADKVEWTSQVRGDGAGYDIKSFHTSGAERLIEVKSTRGARTTPFFISRNELSLAHERPEHFRLYRLYDFSQTPRLFKLKPPLEEAVTLEPETWRARVG